MGVYATVRSAEASGAAEGVEGGTQPYDVWLWVACGVVVCASVWMAMVRGARAAESEGSDSEDGGIVVYTRSDSESEEGEEEVTVSIGAQAGEDGTTRDDVVVRRESMTDRERRERARVPCAGGMGACAEGSRRGGGARYMPWSEVQRLNELAEAGVIGWTPGRGAGWK